MLLRHYEKLWGPPSRHARFKRPELEIDVYKWMSEQTKLGVSMYATDGAGAWPMRGALPNHRFEYFCGLHPDHDDIASAVAYLAAFPALNDVAMTHSHTLTQPAEPLWQGSAFETFLVLQQFHTIVPDLEVPGGNRIHFMQAVPVFPEEVEYKNAFGIEGLLEAWERANVDFADADRRCLPSIADAVRRS